MINILLANNIRDVYNMHKLRKQVKLKERRIDSDERYSKSIRNS